jgi:DNA (cytosine-5)-methyltransferase 1
MPDFYEFFAGGGMVRAGLGPGWRCLFANDFDAKKSRSYRENWGSAELKIWHGHRSPARISLWRAPAQA